MAYYRTPLILLGVLFVLSLAACVSASLWARRQHAALSRVTENASIAQRQRFAAEANERNSEREVQPLRAFVRAWEPYLRPASEKELGNHIRNTLATVATRTGLTSEGATVPAEPRLYPAGPRMLRVQQVSLNVVGESLPAVLTWLGAVEEQFAYARVESLTVSGYASRSVQLAVTLLHPVEDSSASGAAVLPTPLPHR